MSNRREMWGTRTVIIIQGVLNKMCSRGGRRGTEQEKRVKANALEGRMWEK
jgi:hypothetical protein